MKHAFELIPLTIEAEGKVIASNVGEFSEMVRGALENINSSFLIQSDLLVDVFRR